MHVSAARFRLVTALLCVTPIVSGNQSEASPERASPIPNGCEQLLVVKSEGWTATSATLQRYAREKNADWRSVGEAVRVNVGRHGMAWGRGLHDARPGPVKLEGDGRTPAGVFPVGALFGYAEQPPADAGRSGSWNRGDAAAFRRLGA